MVGCVTLNTVPPNSRDTLVFIRFSKVSDYFIRFNFNINKIIRKISSGNTETSIFLIYLYP